MFVICNYLDVIHGDFLPDGFVVEDCSKFDASLSGYNIICREHKEASVLEWAQINMNKFYPMFMNQFRSNKQKAMQFIASNGKIESFTSEFVVSCGGIEKFVGLYGAAPREELAPQAVEAAPLEVEPLASESAPQEEAAPLAMETVPLEVVSPPEEEYFAPPEEVYFTPSATKLEDSAMPEEPEHVECLRNCIYNQDGSFKGFTDGQILTLLKHLRDLDKRIALDNLNPSYILDSEDVMQASVYLETIAPSIFKAFILRELEKVHSETDYMRISALMDSFSDYVASLNKD